MSEGGEEDFFVKQFHGQESEPFLFPEGSDDNFALKQDYEGQLACDVFQTKDSVVVKAAVAGVNPDDLDISLHNDMLTIRGKRESDEQVSAEDYYYQECYWGGFSRTIILPVEVQADKIKASFRNGILTIVLPKVDSERKIDINVE